MAAMKVRNNVLWSYSLVTFAMTMALSITMGLVLASNLENYEVQSHVQTFPQIIQLAFQDEPSTRQWFLQRQPTPPPPFLQDHLNQLLHMGKIYRVKVWSPDSTVLWSDSADIVGKTLDNPEMREALDEGQPVYEIGEVGAEENVSEKGRGTTLQIYTPMFQQGKAVGVVELYEDNTELWTQIAENTMFVWILVAVFGAGLYVLLFGVFYRAWRNQRKTNQQLEQTQDVTVFALAYQAELRDHETGKHLERTARYVGLLAEELKLPPEDRRELVKAAPLHDIGKVGIPDAILLKPGALTAEERAVIQTHCELGDQVLAAAETRLPFRSFLSTARELTLSHHEKWDGTGYPRGLKGEDIPLAGRIMALADVYDALRSERPYKQAWPHDKCVEEIVRLSAIHFDPRLVKAFLARQGEFQQ